MKTTVIGPGAVGGLIGALLARSGEPVSFLARGDALRAITGRGIRISAPDGEFSTGPLPASDSPQALGVADLVLVAVKSWQVPGLGPPLQPRSCAKNGTGPGQNGGEGGGPTRGAGVD